MPRILFVTGKLAGPALQRLVADLGPRMGFESEVVVLPISVAALMTPDWIARHLPDSLQGDRAILPGLCKGDFAPIAHKLGLPVDAGPNDLKELPEWLGGKSGPPEGYGTHDLEIWAEINSAQNLDLESLLSKAEQLRREGADVIDLGVDPGHEWPIVGQVIRELRNRGIVVSIDSFDRAIVAQALGAGANKVLSVDSRNLSDCQELAREFPEVEWIAIPSSTREWDDLVPTVETLVEQKVRHRIDPILEPIGGLARSLERYFFLRQRFPSSEFLMGVGNVTELADVDSAGMNLLLASLCRELGIRAVLTTEVTNSARSSVQELAIARMLADYAFRQQVPPKRVDPRLVVLRDSRLRIHGEEGLRELVSQVKDRNYRIVTERGEIHCFNGKLYVRGTDADQLARELARLDPELEVSHALYLGSELQKAAIALKLSKNYVQDQPLDWGYLT